MNITDILLYGGMYLFFIGLQALLTYQTIMGILARIKERSFSFLDTFVVMPPLVPIGGIIYLFYTMHELVSSLINLPVLFALLVLTLLTYLILAVYNAPKSRYSARIVWTSPTYVISYYERDRARNFWISTYIILSLGLLLIGLSALTVL